MSIRRRQQLVEPRVLFVETQSSGRRHSRKSPVGRNPSYSIPVRIQRTILESLLQLRYFGIRIDGRLFSPSAPRFWPGPQKIPSGGMGLRVGRVWWSAVAGNDTNRLTDPGTADGRCRRSEYSRADASDHLGAFNYCAHLHGSRNSGDGRAGDTDLDGYPTCHNYTNCNPRTD